MKAAPSHPSAAVLGADIGTSHSPPLFERAVLSKDVQTLRKLRHSLRTPLNQIIGYSELLMETIENPDDPLVHDLKAIHTAGGQILALITDALAPWKMESGKIDLQTMRREALSPLNAIIGYTEMHQEEALEQKLTPLAEDFGKVHTAALNLYHILTGSDLPDRLEIGNTPAALGIAADAVLGQSSVDGALAETPQIANLARPADHARVLVVDDDELNREMLGRRLGRLGYDIDYAANGRLALERLRQKSFDLVLLDILMPELNGFQTLEFIKADPQLHDLPVIMLTALDEVDSTVRAIEAGAEDCVPKPYNPVILNARLAASLEKKRLRDKEQAFLQELKTERAKSERLLLNTMPKAIADRLKAGERVIVDSFGEATVLFADIVGFTRISADMAPRRTVQLLNEIFSALDRLAEAYQIEKIKTIGDAYMAVGGVPVRQPNHAEACANLALDILSTMRAFNRRHDVRWQVRIGLHSGPVVAGIIGTKKFAYDLWGDTVNIASRMESQGQSDCIQVSATTRQLLEEKFRFEERGTLEIKNRGPIGVYHLLERNTAP